MANKFFSLRPKGPPPTRFGYQPPPDAIGQMWICVAEPCGQGGPDYPGDRWPQACPVCGSSIATHRLAEPWEHQARRVEIDKRLTSMPQYGDPAKATADDLVWRLEQALRDGSVQVAESFREKLDSYLGPQEAANAYFNGGDHRFQVCYAALEHQAWSLLVGELTSWRSAALLEDLEDNNTRRTNCRQLAACMIAYLEDPRSAQSHYRADVWNTLTGLMKQIHSVATADINTAFARLSRVFSGGNREEDAMIEFLVRCDNEDREAPTAAAATMPTTTARRMAVFARHTLAGADSGIDTSLIWRVCLEPYMRIAMTDPARLTDQMAAATLTAGGPGVFGASRCLQEFVGRDRETACYLAVLDAGLDFLHGSPHRAFGLTVREHDRWTETHGPGTW